MLRVVTGVFQPDLEQALVEDIRQHKTSDPLGALLLIVPSQPLKRRLVRLLCHEHGQTLLNVRILTFHQFALDLLAEAGSPLPERFPSEAFFTELVGAVLANAGATLSAWQSFLAVPGAWNALWRTIRDLKNAGLDASRLETLLQDTDPLLASRWRDPQLLRILQLASQVLAAKRELSVVDYDDLFAQAAEHVPTSPLLKACRRVICYGFYDLHQLQLDFLRALVRDGAVTMYVPLIRGHQAFVFAQQFFDRHIQGLCSPEILGDINEPVMLKADGQTITRSLPQCSPLRDLFEDRTAQLEDEGSQDMPSIRRLDVPDAWDEIDFIAKDILQMVEERGYAFDEIGIVARSLEAYAYVIPRLFSRHRIPFSSTMARPLDDYPLGQAIRLLLGVRETNFQREVVLELLGSPCLQVPSRNMGELRALHDYWDASTRHLGITRGFEQWQRLAGYVQKDLTVAGRVRDSEEEAAGQSISAETIALLWHVIQDLHDHLHRFPDQASWADFTSMLMAVCERYFAMSDGRRAVIEMDECLDQGHHAVADAVYEGLMDLVRLTPVRSEVSFADFAASVRRLLRQLTIPVSSSMGVGVQVLDAMEARGVSFRVLYVIGVNDGHIPRMIQEDAFLRDRHRRWIEMDLGYKLPEKLAAIQEEKLLWYLLVNAAREVLVLSSHRADARNRPLTPSPYLAELEGIAGSIASEKVPRLLSQKVARLPQYHETRLRPQDLGILWGISSRAPHGALARIHPAWTLLARAESALREHERATGALSVFDGCVGSLEQVRHRLLVRGCSPTELDEYARCPFRYFAKRILQIDALFDPGAVEEVSPAEWGTMIHEILRETYALLHHQGYFVDREGIDPLQVIESVARDAFARFASNTPTGYALFWELRCEQILSFLKDVVQEDLEELVRSGWRPVGFETPVQCELPEAMGGPLMIQGRLDRVDRHAGHKEIRVIDYKCKWSSKPDSHDGNLALSAIRARTFQPPLYVAAVTRNHNGVPEPEEWMSQRCEGVWFYYLAPRWRTAGQQESPRFVRVKFPGHAWQSPLREPLRRAVEVVVDGIRSGRFFIRPGSHCDSCAYFSMCRKTHDPTRWRVRRDATSSELFRIAQTPMPVVSDTSQDLTDRT